MQPMQPMQPMQMVVCDPGGSSGAFLLIDEEKRKVEGHRMPATEPGLVALLREGLRPRSSYFLMEHLAAPHRGGRNSVQSSIKLAENQAQIRILARALWGDAVHLVPPRTWQTVVPFDAPAPERLRKPVRKDAATQREYAALLKRHENAVKERDKARRRIDAERKEHYRKFAESLLERDWVSSGMFAKGRLIKSWGFADAFCMYHWFRCTYGDELPEHLIA